METKKRKRKKNFTGIQGDGVQIGGGAYLQVRLIYGRLRYIIPQGSFPKEVFLEGETQLFAERHEIFG